MTGQELWASLLQEAIQGRLVEQNSMDEDAKSLLMRNAEARAVDIKKKTIKASRLRPVSDEDKKFELPKNWSWVRLGELCEKVGAGSTPTGGSRVYQKSGILFLREQNIHDEGLRLQNVVFIDKETNSKMKGSIVKSKDILMNITGASIGRNSLVPDNFDIANINQHVLILRLIIKDIRFYLHYFLCSPFGLEQMTANQLGDKPGLSAARVMNFLIPLPPLAEQRRIVARLEGLRPLVDDYGAAEAELTRVEAELPDKLRASLLQEAIQGRLVEQRNDEPAVEQIGEAPEDVPFAIPEKWKWVRLGACVECNPKIAADPETEVSFVPMADVAAGYMGGMAPAQTKNWALAKSGFSRFADGDVILAKITPCFQNRKSAICTGLTNGLGFGSTEFHVLRSGRKIDRRYLLSLVKSAYFIAYGVEHFKGTAGQKRLGTREMLNCPIPLPPLAEQRRIVARLEELLPEVAKLVG